MRFVVAPDSYKGSVSALEAALAMEAGIKRIFPEALVAKAPVADGGEGTVLALVEATGGAVRRKNVTGPLGREVEAVWGILGDGKTAVIEMAASSGLPLVPFAERDPLAATTAGAGQLILEVLAAGFRRLVLGIGGSAANDGGAGALRALGARFLNSSGEDLPEGGGALSDLERIELSGLDPRLQELEILVACDVDNPLCGERGASAVFGPQKGATPEMCSRLDAALAHYADIAEQATGRNVRNAPGAGAAGGLGAGLLFFTGAILRPGVEIVLEAVNFDALASAADVIMTGEGNTDFQTVFGKAPIGVAAAAKRFNKPVICVSGGLGRGYRAVYDNGIDAAVACPSGPMSLQQCIELGPEPIRDAAERVCRLLRVGMGLNDKRSS
jgi:glycerate kinase